MFLLDPSITLQGYSKGTSPSKGKGRGNIAGIIYNKGECGELVEIVTKTF